MENEALDCEGLSISGLKYLEFEDLPEDKKRKIVVLMAKVMERAYRRGVQQTLYMLENDLIDVWILEDMAYAFRYEKPLEDSIGLDGSTTSSTVRLCIEENLDYIGLT